MTSSSTSTKHRSVRLLHLLCSALQYFKPLRNVSVPPAVRRGRASGTTGISWSRRLSLLNASSCVHQSRNELWSHGASGTSETSEPCPRLEEGFGLELVWTRITWKPLCLRSYFPWSELGWEKCMWYQPQMLDMGFAHFSGHKRPNPSGRVYRVSHSKRRFKVLTMRTCVCRWATGEVRSWSLARSCESRWFLEVDKMDHESYSRSLARVAKKDGFLSDGKCKEKHPPLVLFSLFIYSLVFLELAVPCIILSWINMWFLLLVLLVYRPRLICKQAKSVSLQKCQC